MRWSYKIFENYKYLYQVLIGKENALLSDLWYCMQTSLSDLDDIVTGLEIFLESFLCGSEVKFQQLGLRGINISVVLCLGWAIHNIIKSCNLLFVNLRKMGYLQSIRHLVTFSRLRKWEVQPNKIKTVSME